MRVFTSHEPWPAFHATGNLEDLELAPDDDIRPSLQPSPSSVWTGKTGILPNPRGLVELIVLNQGLRAGVLTPRLFAALVLMALITTAMTVPAFDVFSAIKLRATAT